MKFVDGATKHSHLVQIKTNVISVDTAKKYEYPHQVLKHDDIFGGLAKDDVLRNSSRVKSN